MKKCCLFVLLVASVCIDAKQSLITFSDLQSYASTLEEGVPASNLDWNDPDFSSYHKSRVPNVAWRFFQSIGAGREFFTIAKFKRVLQSLIQEREAKQLSERFIQAMVPKPGTRFFVWGDLHGAFHSLVRDLGELHNRGIINDDMRIVSKDVFFIFNGNVINRSPYSLETLFVVMQLMRTNPGRVLYVRGHHEDKEAWLSYGLERDLRIRAKHLSRQRVPLGKEVTQFFNTLPLALYLVDSTDKSIDTIRISSYGRNFFEIDEQQFGAFLDKAELNNFLPFKLSESAPSEKSVRVKSIVTSEDRRIRYKKTDGLHVGGTQQDSTSWEIFSSPTRAHQNLYRFNNDAFAEIIVANPFDRSLIMLYSRDIRKDGGFVTSVARNMITTQKVDPFIVPMNGKVEPIREVIFGSTMDLSKSTSPIGKRVDEGLRLRFEKQISDGGVHGLIPRIMTFDDQYTPSKTRQAVEALLNDFGVDLLIGSQGSPSLEAYLDLIKDKKVLVMFPFTGAPIFRRPDLTHVIHGARVSYVHEGRILTEYAIDQLKAKRFALFYQNDAFGYGPLQGAREALKKAKIQNWVEIPYERNDVSFANQSAKMRAYNPDAVLFLSTATAAKGLIRQMGVQYFSSRKLLGLSVYEDSFERFLKDKGLQFVLTRMVPNPHESDLEIVKEYREQAIANDFHLDKLSLEMYINASILFDILARVDGPISKEKIIEVAQNLKNHNLGGLIFDFNAQTRELSRTIWLDPGNGQSWIQYDVRQE